MNTTLPELPVPQTELQRRLVYMATRRSMVEMEQVLHGFLVSAWEELDDSLCLRLIGLLEHSDPDLFDWLGGLQPLPNDVDAVILKRLAAQAQKERPGQEGRLQVC